MDVKDNVSTTARSVTFHKEHFICNTCFQRIEGICFLLSQVLPLVLEASSQWDEGTRCEAVSYS